MYVYKSRNNYMEKQEIFSMKNRERETSSNNNDDKRRG